MLEEQSGVVDLCILRPYSAVVCRLHRTLPLYSTMTPLRNLAVDIGEPLQLRWICILSGGATRTWLSVLARYSMYRRRAPCKLSRRIP